MNFLGVSIGIAFVLAVSIGYLSTNYQPEKSHHQGQVSAQVPSPASDQE